MKKAFTVELYIKVFKDTFKVSRVSEPNSEHVFISSEPFTTKRLLVGEFGIAERCLKNAIKSVVGTSFIPKSVSVVLHPQKRVLDEKTDTMGFAAVLFRR